MYCCFINEKLKNEIKMCETVHNTILKSQYCRQRGLKGKGVVFTNTPIAESVFNPHPGHVVASLDKALYDDYLCLVALNKQ